MAATVIDALLITLGLDTSDFRKGQKDVSDDLKKQREDAKKTAKEMAEQGKRQQHSSAASRRNCWH